MPLIFCHNQLIGSPKTCKYAFDKGRNQLRGLAMALLMRLQHFHDNCELEMLDLGTIQLYFFFNQSQINTLGLGIHAITLIWHYRFVSSTLLQMLTQLHLLLKLLWRNKNRQSESIFKYIKSITLRNECREQLRSLEKWFRSYLWLQTKQKQIRNLHLLSTAA